MVSKKEMEFKHNLEMEMEMEKLEYMRKTDLMILEKQWELAHRQPMQLKSPQYYPQEEEVEESEKSEKKYGRKKK